MAIINPSLVLPPDAEAGLATGSMMRIGGVIRHSKGSPPGGQIAYLLKDLSPIPRALGENIPSILNMVGSVTSIINLGATVGFGIATLNKLGKMDSKLDGLHGKLRGIDSKLDEMHGDLKGMDVKLNRIVAGMKHIFSSIENIQWSVDLGFAYTFTFLSQLEEKLDNIHFHLEAGLIAELVNAAEQGWMAQKKEPGPDRKNMLIPARHDAGKAATHLKLLTGQKFGDLMVSLQKTKTPLPKLKKASEMIPILHQLRLLVLANAIYCKLMVATR